MTDFCALVPIKKLSRAKTRLAPILRTSECAALAESMLRDVLTALTSTPQISQVVLFSNDARVTGIAQELDCRVLREEPVTNLCDGLNRAAAQLGSEGVENLFIIHGDLPMIKSTDIVTLLNCYREGLVICPAEIDGGTNALIINPADALPFQFGADSARKHMEAASGLNIKARQISIPAFSHDIDTPDDLRRFCANPVPGHTRTCVEQSGIARRLEEQAAVA